MEAAGWQTPVAASRAGRPPTPPAPVFATDCRPGSRAAGRLAAVAQKKRRVRDGRYEPDRSCHRAGRCMNSLYPVPVRQKVAVQARFAAAWLRLPVVAPFDDRRHRHQDRFVAAARLQPEQCTAVVYQIEFDIAAAPVRLKIAFTLAVRHRLAPLHDRQIGIEEAVADALHHRETLRKVERIEIVEKDAAHAARSLAM